MGRLGAPRCRWWTLAGIALFVVGLAGAGTAVIVRSGGLIDVAGEVALVGFLASVRLQAVLVARGRRPGRRRKPRTVAEVVSLPSAAAEPEGVAA